MFPPSFFEAVKLSLMNEPIYHGQLTQTAVCEKIQNEGDFLVQDGHDSQSLLLSIFSSGVRNFLIIIEQTECGARFRVGAERYESLNDLTFQMKTVKINSEIIKLGTAIYRIDNSGRFGPHCVVDELPRSALKTIIPLPKLKHKSVFVPLRRNIIHDGIEEELESLIVLKHRHLVHLVDFVSYNKGPFILRYQSHDSVSLYDSLLKEFHFEREQILKWIKQAASLVYYLVKKDCLHSIICAQDCYLDFARNLKFRGAWNSNWSGWKEDTLKHPFYWRFIAPESLLNEKHNASSMIWNLGVFMWQLSTHCLLPPFPEHQSRQSFLEAVFSGKLCLEYLRPSSLGHQCNTMPQSIVSLISSCVVLKPEKRSEWSNILNTTKQESLVAFVGGVMKRILPFV